MMNQDKTVDSILADGRLRDPDFYADFYIVLIAKQIIEEYLSEAE